MTRSHRTLRLVSAAILFVAAALSWIASDLATSIAADHERLATLRPRADDAADLSNGWHAWIARLLDHDVDRHALLDRYWHGDRDGLTTSTSNVDATDLLLSADAAFRRIEPQGAALPQAVGELERVLEAYAATLRNDGFNPDAAFNYEYVARLRDLAAQAKSPKPRPAAPAPAVKGGDDLPAGPTIHGRPGRHPAPTRGNDFEVLTPMDFGDREAQPEPTPGQKLPRKG
jgi:hypothetical protein